MVDQLSNTNLDLKGANIIENNKPPRMRVGTDDFKTLLLNSDVFVDKSLMIKELLEDSGDVILITRPRRWGKSMNMDMIKRFLEREVDQKGTPLPEADRVNHKLFVGGEIDLGFDETKELKPLKIASNTSSIKRQGQFPVISINFKDVKGSNYQKIESGVRINIQNAYGHHKYLENSDKISVAEKKKFQDYLTGQVELVQLQISLRFLSELLFKHFAQKVYILIDEYDTPINSSYIKFGDKSKEFEQVLELFRAMFGSGLKTNPFLERGVITGILRVAKAELFSGLNNVQEYTLLDKKFAKSYGFTQAEVDELLSKVPTKTSPEEIKNWYNGYTFGGEIIYNPWSIMQCLSREGELGHYWIDSGGTGLIDKVLLSDEIQADMQELLEGRGIVKKLYRQVSLGDIDSNKDIFYSLLVFAGYLNPCLANDNEENPRYRLTIPNKEVREIYVERVTNWLTKKLNIDNSDYDNFIALLINQQIDKFGEKLREYLLNSTSYHDLTGERDYHNLMGGLFAPLVSQYTIESNKEAGNGRCDHILIPIAGRGDRAIIIEYKISKVAKDLESITKTGLEQINNKQYYAKIKQHEHVKKIGKLSMAFCGKEVAWEYEIDVIS